MPRPSLLLPLLLLHLQARPGLGQMLLLLLVVLLLLLLLVAVVLVVLLGLLCWRSPAHSLC